MRNNISLTEKNSQGSNVLGEKERGEAKEAQDIRMGDIIQYPSFTEKEFFS